ncbi:MAG: hypothetical protein HYX89_06845 [Chloroflexi bacterium]|nr:hypothetical protein [Chloroflexota bacterium]
MRARRFFSIAAIVLVAVLFSGELPQRRLAAAPMTVDAQADTRESTAVAVQNLDPAAAATVQVEYYSVAGYLIWGPTLTINPGANGLADQRYDPNLPDGFRGSMVLRASTDIAAIANQVGGSGNGFYSDSYNALPLTEVATTIRLPFIIKNIYDAGTGLTWNSTFAVQNASGSTANVTLTYTHVDGRVFQETVQVAPYSSLFRDQSVDPVLPAQFYGSAVVTSDQQVAAIVNQRAYGRLTTYRGVKDGATTLYVPFLLKNIRDVGTGQTWGTAIAVQYAGPPGGSAQVTLSYYPVGGDPNHPYVTVGTVSSASPVLTFDQRYDGNLPGSFYGSGLLEATAPVTAIVNQVSNQMAMSYNAFSAGSQKISLPFLVRNIYDSGTDSTWGSAFVVYNTSSSPASVWVTYYAFGGPGQRVGPYSVGPRGLLTFDQRFDPSLGNIFSGSAVVEADQPVVAIVNQVGTGPGDKANDYQGVAR